MDGLFTRVSRTTRDYEDGGSDGGDLNPECTERRYLRRAARAGEDSGGVYGRRSTTGVLHNSLHNIIGPRRGLRGFRSDAIKNGAARELRTRARIHVEVRRIHGTGMRQR